MTDKSCCEHWRAGQRCPPLQHYCDAQFPAPSAASCISVTGHRGVLVRQRPAEFSRALRGHATHHRAQRDVYCMCGERKGMRRSKLNP